ncbi:hypothetical protein [Streptomyces sp. NPDC058726]|uniref:hypothetical protein n=1 Tax=unclassified Streptomyces TaxID=2593676 RepID=UPI00364D3479
MATLYRTPGYSETLPRRPESAARARHLDDLAEDGPLIVSEPVSDAMQQDLRDRDA